MKLTIRFYFFLVFFALLFADAYAQQKQVVFYMEIRDKIDPRMSRYVSLALDEARTKNADYVFINMNTYGGRVIDADSIRMDIMNYPEPVVVHINKNAASAGALISIACDSIYMTQGASMGAATVVKGGSGSKAPDKYQSYMRSKMRSTAEATGRDPELAEAMVDPAVEIDSTLKKTGQVLTLTTSEAIKWGYCEGKAESFKEIVEGKLGLSGYKVIRYEQSTVERIIAVFLNPVISSILIMVILGGIYFEMQTPGIGFPLIMAVIAALLYFMPYYLHGLADNWEIFIFILGLVLIALEVFVIPGFGIAGISGLVLVISGLMLVMIGNDFFDFTYVPEENISAAVLSVLSSILLGFILLIIGGNKMVKSNFFKNIELSDEIDINKNFTDNPKDEILNTTGIAYTVLRPSGKVKIGDKIYFAYTRGEYIEPNTAVIVVDYKGSNVIVKEYEV